MFIKIQRLEGRNRRLETKEIYLQVEINLLKRENQDLIKENETLKNEKEAITNAFHIQMRYIEAFVLDIKNFSIVNSILETNRIEIIPLSSTRRLYSSFEDAIEATNISKKFVEINQDGEEIEEYLLPRSYSFVQEETGECSNFNNIQDEIGECSNSNNIDVEIDDREYSNNGKNENDIEIFDIDMFEV
ncbi:4209_t:CDS:2 [Cetraspora pellucida]|uniref:4209_t:CDS:1 n=1 Tax=Cetraspora pellucida TaxID=1433469 RepID=A0ACA9JXA6_9GLOM|nr:4209_t:CDS:2 [Cetraspora pellucida]